MLAELPAGQYTVRVESAGLSSPAQNVRVDVGLATTVNFGLTQLQQRKEQITITEEAPLVETSRDVLGEVVDRQLVENLPLNGRDFGKLVALVPGATVEPSGVAAIQSGFEQFAINGNRDRSNNYTLDGTDNNDPFFNNSAFNQTGIGGAPADRLYPRIQPASKFSCGIRPQQWVRGQHRYPVRHQSLSRFCFRIPA